MRFLVIEDDPKIVKDISFYLGVRFPESTISSSGEGIKGIKRTGDEYPDLVIVDSSLPDMDHIELIKRVRQFSAVPLLVLSDMGTDVDLARDLEAGADDYVLKPLNPIEFLSRIGALMRRSSGFGFYPQNKVFINDQITIDFNSREVFLSGKKVDLTHIEYELFSELARNTGRVLTHSVILQKVWGIDSIGDRNLIKKYIYRLRSKLDPDGVRRMLVTERGVGYRLMKQDKISPY
ncbi:MAG: response regulator transcription factor [Dehalococcoidales bacterium]|nr:response regulator transcription factor [Dehalococcoidales bacterium]